MLKCMVQCYKCIKIDLKIPEHVTDDYTVILGSCILNLVVDVYQQLYNLRILKFNRV